MTKTLTEQWKDGELEKTHYYVRLENGRICRCLHFGSSKWMRAIDGLDKLVQEVLAPVPNYQEFVQQRDFVKDHTKVLIENMNLKRKLDIATKALKEYADCKPTEWMSCVTADKALKEMEGVK